jgi:hypothetical protein
LDLTKQAAKFRESAAANGRRYVSWNAAFTTWLMNAEEWSRGNGSRFTPKPRQPDHPSVNLDDFAEEYHAPDH